jgi:hypothetical protein
MSGVLRLMLLVAVLELAAILLSVWSSGSFGIRKAIYAGGRLSKAVLLYIKHLHAPVRKP